MHHAEQLRLSILALLGAAGLLPACAAARSESTTSGGPGDDPSISQTSQSTTTTAIPPASASADTRPPRLTEAKKARVCSVNVAAANGAKVLACREVLAETQKSSMRACAGPADCNQGEWCESDGSGQKVCIHLLGQTPDCASDLDCVQGTRCVLDEGSLTHGVCTRDGCGEACAAGSLCAPYATYDTSMDDEMPDSPPSRGFHPAGLMCLPAAAEAFESRSPPSGMCHVSITTTCRIDDGDWHCTLSGGLGRHPCGRPLLIDGRAKTAAHGADVAPNDLVARVRAIAYDEHASIVAFSRTITQLAALGAPLALIRRTSAALTDEIEHARLAFELLGELDPEAASERPGAFPEALSPLCDAASLRRSLLEDTLRGGAIGESGSVLEALGAREGAPPSVRAFLDRIIEDETRHAALAFETIAWLAADDPGLWSAVAATVRASSDAPVVKGVVAPVFAAMRA
ncbi:MAG: Dickkopf N-terminal cysteine-rich domain-containing protein [Polyangiaceae bacterium]